MTAAWRRRKAVATAGFFAQAATKRNRTAADFCEGLYGTRAFSNREMSLNGGLIGSDGESGVGCCFRSADWSEAEIGTRDQR